jgi:hypothetical protein
MGAPSISGGSADGVQAPACATVKSKAMPVAQR